MIPPLFVAMAIVSGAAVASFLALGNATGVLAGHALGAGDRPRARQAALTGLGVGFALRGNRHGAMIATR